MTAALTDDQLDAALTAAGARLRAGTATVTVGAAPSPSPSFPSATVLRAAAAVVLVGGTVAGLGAVARHDAAPPADERDGRSGLEIVLQPVDDADGNADTTLLRATAGAGEVVLYQGSDPASLAGITMRVGERAQWCFMTSGAGGRCLTDAGTPTLLLGPREAGGQAAVFGLPDDVTIVRFDAGPAARAWTRPRKGVALFPFPTESEPSATATLVRADGSVVAELAETDASLTADELATRRTTTLTDETLTTALVAGEAPDGIGIGTTYLRRHGRTAATGFDGPFALQQLAFAADDRAVEVVVLTVPTDRAAEARARLGTLLGGRVAVPRDDVGVVSLVWADDRVPSAVLDRLVAGLQASVPAADVIDLDRPRTWAGNGDTTMLVAASSPALQALLFDTVVGVTIDGSVRSIRGGADDLGVVQYVLGDEPIGAVITPGRPPLLPTVGDDVAPGLWPVPASTATLTLTLDDGSTITPQLVDVRPTSDAKLALLPSSTAGRRITAVSST